MKLTLPQMQALAQLVVKQWKDAKLVDFKVDEKVVTDQLVSILKAEIQKEIDLDKEVHAMLDKLESSHSGQFERHKMYPLLRSKLAKEKKVIL